MKELYEEITEVKFYHDPFKGYADNYILGSEEVFVDTEMPILKGTDRNYVNQYIFVGE